MQELKPCPFCGGRAYIEDHSRFLGNFRCKPQCDNMDCVLGSQTTYASHEEAIAAWNARKS